MYRFSFIRSGGWLLVAAVMMSLHVLAGSAKAAVTSFDDIEFWVGTGSNRAAAVIDFNNGQPALVWGYQWDGVATGYDMFAAIDAADDRLSLDMPVDPTFGPYFNGATYDTTTASADFVTGSFWIYWNGPAYDQLSDSWYGLRDRVLDNGSWDAFAYLTTDPNVWPPSYTFPEFVAAQLPTGTDPLTPAVPEPASLSLLALGGAALLAARRRR